MSRRQQGEQRQGHRVVAREDLDAVKDVVGCVVGEARNAADSLIHQSEKSLTEFGDKVEAADKEKIETAIAELREVKDDDDVEPIQAKTQALAEAAMKLGEAMYKAQQEEAAAAEAANEAAAGGDSDGDETVVDADFEEVDGESKGEGEGDDDDTKKSA